MPATFATRSRGDGALLMAGLRWCSIDSLPIEAHTIQDPYGCSTQNLSQNHAGGEPLLRIECARSMCGDESPLPA